MSVLFKRIADALASAIDDWDKKCEEAKASEEAEHIDQIRDKGESLLKNSKQIFLEISKQIGSSALTENNQSLLREFEEHVLKTNYYEILEERLTQLKKLNFEAERVKMLVFISNKHENVVIVGANGSGKSTFIDSLHNTNLSNLTVISAQKLLVFSDSMYEREKITVKKYTETVQNDRNNQFKSDSKTGNLNMNSPLDSPFTYLITALVNNDVEIKYNIANGKIANTVKSKWEQLLDIWSLLIPDIKFSNDSNSRTPTPIQNGEAYDINKLSDGEKCILFYIGNVLLAKKNGYIIVDEPETYLNPAIYNKLWDELMDRRDDCRFIFASHNPDFIMARKNTSFIWIKKFIPPSKMDMKTLDLDEGIPLALQVELVGSRKPLLFCEGSKASYDYQVYSSLYVADYTVVPVKGHDLVIRYTEIFNKMQTHYGNFAVGIIDRDDLPEDEVDRLKEKKIVCLPYNEIEMLLLDEVVMKSVLEPFTTSNTDDKINNFKKAAFSYLRDEKERVIYIFTKNIIDRELRRLFINSKRSPTVDKLKENVESIPNIIDVQKIEESVTNRVDRVLDGGKYDELLAISPLKKEIAGGLADKLLDKPYINKAIARIKKSPNLQCELRKRIRLAPYSNN